MESHILEIIEEEISRRVSLRINAVLNILSDKYDIPLDKLARDSALAECRFCKGYMKNKKRCMKEPKENGYCGFHKHQEPPPVATPVDRVKAPWET
jgi:hypothetical protein